MSWSWELITPGTWVIFAVVLLPVYTAIIGWFIGTPRDPKIGLMGLGYLIGLILALWLPMFILTVLIGIVFF